MSKKMVARALRRLAQRLDPQQPWAITYTTPPASNTTHTTSPPIWYGTTVRRNTETR